MTSSCRISLGVSQVKHLLFGLLALGVASFLMVGSAHSSLPDKYSCSDQRLVALAEKKQAVCSFLTKEIRLEKDIAASQQYRTRSIRQLIKPRHINGMSVSSKYLKALKKLYKRNGYKPLWSKNKKWTANGRQLRARLINAALDGLNPLDYPALPAHPSDVGVGLSDLRLSYGLMRFSEHVMAGRLRPSDILKEHDLKPVHPKLIATIDELLKSERPNDVLDALAPPHEAYKLLKQKLSEELLLAKEERNSTFIHKIVSNMERWRWMPREFGERYIWVNLPSYKTELIENGQAIFDTRSIIGDVTTPTPLIASRIKNIIMNPSWVLPASVIKREILDVYEDPTEYLAKNKIRIFKRRGREVDPKLVDWKKIKNPRTYVFKQDAGDWNVLGKVKILFPNQHSIYLHDTDEKHLFKRDARALSHGCIRLEDPIKFADVIATYDKHLTSQSPKSQLGDREIWLKYKAKLPVYLSYFTLTPGENNALIEYDDVYQYDLQTADQLGNSIF